MTKVYYTVDLLLVVDRVVEILMSQDGRGLVVIAPRAISVRTECQGTTCLDLGRTPRPTKGWSGSVKLRYWRPEKFLRVRPAERLNWPEEREDTPLTGL